MISAQACHSADSTGYPCWFVDDCRCARNVHKSGGKCKIKKGPCYFHRIDIIIVNLATGVCKHARDFASKVSRNATLWRRSFFKMEDKFVKLSDRGWDLDMEHCVPDQLVCTHRGVVQHAPSVRSDGHHHHHRPFKHPPSPHLFRELNSCLETFHCLYRHEKNNNKKSKPDEAKHAIQVQCLLLRKIEFYVSLF